MWVVGRVVVFPHDFGSSTIQQWMVTVPQYGVLHVSLPKSGSA